VTSDAQAGPRAGVPAYVVMDTEDPYKIAPFWCALLEVEVSSDRDAGHVVSLEPSPALGGMVLALQRVPETKVGKNRMHFDVYVDDLESATAHVVELGGQRWAEHSSATVNDGGLISRIMADPEGNEFCLVLTFSKKWHPEPGEAVIRMEGRIAGAD